MLVVGLLLAVFMWSSEFVGVSYCVESISPGSLALGRYLISSVFMLICYLVMPNKSKIIWTDVPMIFFLSVVGIAGYAIGLNYGEQSVSAGTAGFIVSQMPIVMAILGHLFLGERLTWYMLLGIITGCIGIALISYDGIGIVNFNKGLIAIILGTLGACIYSTLQKPFLTRYSAIEWISFMVWSTTIALMIYTPNLMAEINQMTLPKLSTMVYLAIFPAGVAYIIWAYAIARRPVTQVGSYLYLCPIFATALGWSLLGQIPTKLGLIGGCIALFGAILVNANWLEIKCLTLNPEKQV